MSFYQDYELVDQLRDDDGIKTFNARENATGRAVFVHLLTRPESRETQALLRKVAKLAPEGRAQIVAEGNNDGTPYVVTLPIVAYAGFREWLVAQKSAAVAPAPSIVPDDPFAALFKKEPTPQAQPYMSRQAAPAPPQPAPAPRPSPQSAASQDFRELIETPTRKGPTIYSTPPAGGGNASEPADLAHIYVPPPPQPPEPEGPPTGPSGTRIMSTEDFMRVFESQRGAASPDAPTAQERAPAPADSPGEFTRMFQAPVAPPEPVDRTKGEFTRLFEAPVTAEAPTAAPAEPAAAHEAGEFTRMFQSPAASKPSAPEAAAGPESGEFTRMFQSPLAAAPQSATPAPPKKAPAERFEPPTPEATQHSPAPSAAESAAGPESGEFTRMFQSPVPAAPPRATPQHATPAPPAPSVPEAASPESGEFTRMFQSPIPAAPKQAQPQPATAPEPGEFTKTFNAPIMPPKPARPVPAAPAEAAAPPESGEFTRMFITPAPPANVQPTRPQPPPPQMAQPQVAQPPGEFTSMFNAPASGGPPPPPRSAPPPGQFTSMFSAPVPEAPAPPRPAGPQPPAGEFTSMFNAPAPAPAFPPPPGPPRSDEGGEFTRMFNSPLQPAPLKPAQGPADPFAGAPKLPPPQAAPVGEYTMMFGRGDAGKPPAPPPLATPTPRAPTGEGATNVFKTPPPPAYAPPSSTGGGYSAGASSQGASDFTGMMKAPSESVLAQAAAANTGPEQKSFFNKYGALILVGVGLLLVFVVILVVFSMRKH